jgi:hypothetical protein
MLGQVFITSSLLTSCDQGLLSHTQSYSGLPSRTNCTQLYTSRKKENKGLQQLELLSLLLAGDNDGWRLY